MLGNCREDGGILFLMRRMGLLLGWLSLSVGLVLAQAGKSGASPSVSTLQQRFDRAIQLARQGKYEQAATLLRQILKEQPNLAPAHLNLGLVYRMQGQSEKAAHHLRRAAELDPRNPMPLVELARLALDRNRLDEASGYLRMLRDHFPNHPELPLLTGSLAALKGDWKQAYAEFTKSLKTHPNDFRIHYNLGIAAYQMGRKEEARQHLQKTVQLKPDYSTAWKSLGMVYEALQQPREAVRAYTEALQLEPDDLPTRLKRAQLFQQLQEWENACADYQHLAKIYPKNPDVHLGAGLMLMRLQRYAEAKQYLGQALQLHNAAEPLYWEILTEIAYCELNLKEYGKAREHFAEVLKYNPRHGRAYEGQFRVLQGQEAEQEILPLLRRWAENLPEEPYPRLQVALIYERNREYTLAETEYKSLLEKFPNRPELRREYARFLSRQGRLDEAVQQYDLLLQQTPDELGALLGKARLLERRQQYRDALQLYLKVLAKEPLNTVAALGAAAMYRELGEIDEAGKLYRQQALQPEPSELAISNAIEMYQQANRVDDAVAFLRECIRMHGYRYLNLLASLLIRHKRSEEAIQEYQQAIRTLESEAPAEPKQPKREGEAPSKPKQERVKTLEALYQELGLIYRQLNRPQDALQAFQRASQLNPTRTWTLYQIAELQQQLGNKVAAWETLVRALQTNPDDLSLYPFMERLAAELQRGSDYRTLIERLAQQDTPGQEAAKAYVEWLRRSGQAEDALRWLETRLRQRPDDVPLLRLQLSLLEELGRQKAALPLYARLARLVPDDTALLRSWAIRADEYGTTLDALHAYEALFRAFPDDVSAGLKLVTLYEQLGNRERAQQLLRQLSENFPNNEEVKRRLNSTSSTSSPSAPQRTP
ncbi:Beta-barrel assembly-enhancing protease [bacterium HR15]|nr:Beta-barrel assembly-enhancing protease [bacterium HR15]